MGSQGASAQKSTRAAELGEPGPLTFLYLEKWKSCYLLRRLGRALRERIHVAVLIMGLQKIG